MDRALKVADIIAIPLNLGIALVIMHGIAAEHGILVLLPVVIPDINNLATLACAIM
jgi:hypothetical protein